MKNDPAIVIRPYRSGDREAVRRIACATALMGAPSSLFFDDDEVFADALTLYFTDHEPRTCFVAESDGAVIGYLLGAEDVGRMGKVMGREIIWPLLIKALTRGTFFRWKTIVFLSHVLLSLVKGEFGAADFAAAYPATLHVNLIDGRRAQGIGSRLIDVYLDHLKARGVKGLHFGTMSDQAGRFYLKHGFKLLSEQRRSYLHYVLGRDIRVCIYGMRFDKGPA